jgi:hypothetical protein
MLDDLIYGIIFFTHNLQGAKMLPASKGLQGLPN